MSQLFISYSRQDRDFVDGLIRDIEEAGFDLWMDRADIRGGAQWRAAITQAIRDCAAFLVVLSPNSVDSKNVGRELELAADNHRPVMPIIYEECEIPANFEYHFAGVQLIDFSANNPNALDQLIDGLKSLGGDENPKRKESRPAPRSSESRRPANAALSSQKPPPLPLVQLLPGQWNVQITPMMGFPAHLTLALAPHGIFQGQLMKPMGMGTTVIQGQWQVTPMNEIVIQGQETNGYQIGPYAAAIQIQEIGLNRLVGVTTAGERVIWQKVA
jgi:hypothetical protein